MSSNAIGTGLRGREGVLAFGNESLESRVPMEDYCRGPARELFSVDYAALPRCGTPPPQS
ncbi:hypothetical protein FOVG_16502 [Fusarium oxysporum f. sp. pisi HDV247]|uniref:Uncharacterized protein n=1 Tax=Fusarium oxysporum f. sp. pisi HDV247 TaxID=1080344 RepID=W9NQG6_FUSOX|nr:hypothetical protein FOVG_16502 [Fusarium oxysporum f. sp. pisi HDV247]